MNLAWIEDRTLATKWEKRGRRLWWAILIGSVGLKFAYPPGASWSLLMFPLWGTLAVPCALVCAGIAALIAIGALRFVFRVIWSVGS